MNNLKSYALKIANEVITGRDSRRRKKRHGALYGKVTLMRLKPTVCLVKVAKECAVQRGEGSKMAKESHFAVC